MTVNKTKKDLGVILENTEQALSSLGGALDSNVGASLLVNNGLPEGWVGAPIGDVAGIFNGRAFKQTEWAKTGLPIIRIQNLNKPTAMFNYFEGELDQRHFVQKGDLLFAWSGTPGTSFGAHEWKSDDAALNQHIFKIDLNENCTSKIYFRYAMNHKLQEMIGNANGGVGLRHITKKTFESTLVSYPSLAEQTVIAQTLDTLLAQVDNIKIRLDAIPEILKTFRQSVLTAAVSGKLTEEWRGENECGERSECKVGDVCEKAFDGPFGSKLKTSDYTGFGVRVVRLENVGHLEFFDDKKTYISNEKYETLTKNTLHTGDVLFSSFVEELVRVATFKNSQGTFINKADCFCLRPEPKKVVSDYLTFLLASRSSYWQIKNEVQGVTRPRINLRILKSLTFSFPAIKEQTQIVRRVEELFTFADQIEQQVKHAQERVNNLTQSILAKAFRGELTTEWRAENSDLTLGDNSAEALLAKIKEERDKLVIKKKPRTTKKKVAN
jgi:type I restriction enzyme S subunit